MTFFGRPVRCWFFRCKRILDVSEQRLTLVPVQGHRCVVALCEKHFRALDRATRVRFWHRWKSPVIRGKRVNDKKLYALMYRNNLLYVTQHFAWLTPAQMVYVLVHETVHWWLGNEFGVVSSQAFDLFYNKPLRVLGGETWETCLLHTISDTPKL